METRFPGGRPSELGSLSIRKPHEQARRRKSCYEETSGDAAGFRAVVNKDIGKRMKHRGVFKTRWNHRKSVRVHQSAAIIADGWQLGVAK
jgi:hypothetical protein